MAYIQLNGASRVYKRGKNLIRALDGIDFSIDKGEYIAVVGKSGSGKTTLMNILGCLDTVDSGSYFIAGQDISALGDRELSRLRSREIGFIFQSFNLISGLTAIENVELPLRYRHVQKHQRRQLASVALSRVGLEERMEHCPSELSGGQQQRVAIARAIALCPEVILADEPTGNLDSESGNAVMGLLDELWNEGKTVILITHDGTVAARAKRTVTLGNGKIISDTINLT